MTWEPANIIVQAWFESLPEVVQEKVRQYPPGDPYLLKTTGHVVRILAYSESREGDDDPNPTCDRCQVAVLQRDNADRLQVERRVFGIEFEELGPVPEGYDPPGDRPLEEMPEEMQKRVRELQMLNEEPLSEA